jgi:hypothetical protein
MITNEAMASRSPAAVKGPKPSRLILMATAFAPNAVLSTEAKNPGQKENLLLSGCGLFKRKAHLGPESRFVILTHYPKRVI